MKRNFLTLEQIGEEYFSYAEDLRRGTPTAVFGVSDSFKYLLAGLVVMASGYILMSGGGSTDPEVFNYAMFDFRRMVAAPVVIVLGIIIEIVAIMGMSGKNRKEE